MAINEKYFQGGKDAKYLKASKKASDMANYLSQKFMDVGSKCYDAVNGLKKTAAVPIEIVNELLDYAVQKVLGLKESYKDLSEDGRKNIWNYIKSSLGKEGVGALMGMFSAKDSTSYSRNIQNLAVAASGMVQPATDNLEAKLGVA